MAQKKCIKKLSMYPLLWLLCCVLLVSCGGEPPQSTKASVTPDPTSVPTLSSTTPSAVNMPVPTTGCGKPAPVSPGSSANQTIAAHPEVSRGQRIRSYIVHVPASYKTNQPVALVLIFHGHGGNAADTEKSSGFTVVAEKYGFLTVYPQGLLDDDNLPFWASIGPIDYGMDDALFVSDLLTKLQTDFCVEPRRIYATGFSNGGGMSGFLACKLALRIAAFAPVSGNYYELPGGCHPGRPVPILAIHGTDDPIVPYAGISAKQNPQWPLPAIPQWLQDWATRDGCSKGPIIFLQKHDMTGTQWTNCQGNAAVVHYRMEGGQHSWPSALGNRTTEATMWDFFQAHPLPDSKS